ncbi:hypothetical protein [Achromobacter phage Motura]|uniref:Uncharacterized protein n=1 Tax=Achromobacter phage Motura TaxID=2591403 RepID=A0A514CSY8_9CAUD|nr:hypothetical protein H1O15_gp197 [Achromobacter phage Motura]QDH83591.1 hypothetical protein [Achromobacter phage Motura]
MAMRIQAQARLNAAKVVANSMDMEVAGKCYAVFTKYLGKGKDQEQGPVQIVSFSKTISEDSMDAYPVRGEIAMSKYGQLRITVEGKVPGTSKNLIVVGQIDTNKFKDAASAKKELVRKFADSRQSQSKALAKAPRLRALVEHMIPSLIQA